MMASHSRSFVNLLYPRLKLRDLWPMLVIGFQGAVVAGLYGVMHDQVTGSISPEYFTEFKMLQFTYADFGWPYRVTVGVIGFLATWWVGFISGWFMGRLSVPHVGRALAVKWCHAGFGIILGTAVVFGLGGALYGWGLLKWVDFEVMQKFALSYGVKDTTRFILVAHIHDGSYLGGLLGLVAACFWLRRKVRAHSSGREVAEPDSLKVAT